MPFRAIAPSFMSFNLHVFELPPTYEIPHTWRDPAPLTFVHTNDDCAFFSGLIFHDLCELVWCSGLNVLPGAVRNIAVNSPGYVYPYVLSCKQVAAISKLPHTCFIKRIHPWSSPVVLPRFSRATAGLIAVHMVYVHSGFCCSVILLTSAAACWCVHCACER